MSSEAPQQNVLFILSDEHNPKIAGCYGHAFVQTPNLDALAASGTRFKSAYCNSPICVPSRASLATGRYVHQIGCWDNASPYTGTPKGWHALLRESAVDVVSIGKLHYRGGDDYGFTEELDPLHVVGGVGDLKGLFRKELPKKAGTADLARDAGRGASTYSQYDERIARTARDWLYARAKGEHARPFVLFVSFVMPHFPLIAPEACYDLYANLDLGDLTRGLNAPPPDHPTLNRMRGYFDYDTHFDDETRAVALRAYFGMVTRLDQLAGEVIGTLRETGLGASTSIVYASDHGDNLGNRGMWGKSVMYEDSVGVPLILSGAGVPEGAVVDTPVSLLDIAPTMADLTGVNDESEHYPGQSLRAIANGADPDRVAFAEYHASGSDTGQFMVRHGRWKLVCYIGARPQLFDLIEDPEERKDLSLDPRHAGKIAEMNQLLLTICNPDEVNARAFVAQKELIRAHGGRDVIERSADIPFTPAPSTSANA